MTDLGHSGFGATLRSRREKLGLSLDDLAASTRVRKTYLQALEEENLQALPGKAYAIGFLRIYARHVGLPIEPLLASFNGVEPDDHGEPVSAAAGSSPRVFKKGRRKGGRGIRLFVAVVLLLLAAAVVLFMTLKGRVHPPQPEAPPQPAVQTQPLPPSLPEPPPVAAPQAVVAPAPAQGQPEIVVTELPVLPVDGAVVRMLPVSPGVMKVSLDSQEVREYQLQPDQSLNWKVSASLACELSAPGLVRVWVDQQEIAVAEYPAFVLKAGSRQESSQ